MRYKNIKTSAQKKKLSIIKKFFSECIFSSIKENLINSLTESSIQSMDWTDPKESTNPQKNN